MKDGFGSDVGRSANCRDNLVSFHPPDGLENTAYDTLLSPSLSRGEVTVLDQASQLGACARAAGGSIVSSTWAEHEVSRIRVGIVGRRKKLDVVD